MRGREPAVSRPSPGRNAGDLPMVDGPGAPWFRSMVEGVIRIFPGRGGLRGFEAAMGSSGPGMRLRRISIAISSGAAMAALIATLLLGTLLGTSIPAAAQGVVRSVFND